MSHFEGDLRVAPDSRFVVVASRWNPRIVDAMVDAARRTFADHGLAANALDVIRVPGAWELPLAAARAARRGYRGIVALGCVVRGETRHFEHVADCCADGLMRVSLDAGIPVANGVLAVELHEDAEARAGGALGNKGEEAVLAVLEMAQLIEQLA